MYGFLNALFPVYKLPTWVVFTALTAAWKIVKALNNSFTLVSTGLVTQNDKLDLLHRDSRSPAGSTLQITLHLSFLKMFSLISMTLIHASV